MIKNPWLSMPKLTKRRIDMDTNFDVYWIKNSSEDNGILFKIPLSSSKFNYSFKEIEIITNTLENEMEIYLVLKNKSNLEIFYILCKDICAAIFKGNNSENIAKDLVIRLKKWEDLLSKGKKKHISLEVEKGLFGELFILKEIITPKFGIKKAILNWTGPEFDKQDFIINENLIEVKTYSTNKGRKVYISSPEQLLFSNIQKLYLVAVEIIDFEKGKTLQQLIEEISSSLEEYPELIDIFEMKIINYGYIKEINLDELHKFEVNSTQIYKVDNTFPQINLANIPLGVSSVKYSIELEACEKNKIEKL